MATDNGPGSPVGGAGRYASGVLALGALGALCALVIFIAEARGGPGRAGFWSLGGAALGVIFIVYGVILLLLRKMGTIGPRRAEH